MQLRVAAWTTSGILLAAAAYELALALGAGSVGPDPGDGAAGADVVFAAALLTMLAGAGIAGAARAETAVALLGPAAAAFLLAFFFTFDAYYAPTLRRHSEGGAVSGRWIALVAALALLLVLGTTALAADGH